MAEGRGRDERFSVPDLGKQFDIEFVERPSELASIVSAFEQRSDGSSG